jgi:hypothetical protein
MYLRLFVLCALLCMFSSAVFPCIDFSAVAHLNICLRSVCTATYRKNHALFGILDVDRVLISPLHQETMLIGLYRLLLISHHGAWSPHL